MALAIGFRGLHGGSWLHTLTAIVIAVVGSGLLLGALDAVLPFSLGVPHFLFHLRSGSPIDIWF